jgi:glycosyltransferase involved in cell wall biosynthesis
MLSFIVPAYNEERLLGSSLAAIHHAAMSTGEPYEVIVVDDASTDQTSAVAQSHNARVVRVAHRHIAATRNSGAKVANGDLFIFVDADTKVNAEVIRAAMAAVSDGAVGGGAAIKFDRPTPLYARLLLRILVLSFRLSRIAAGCFVFCTRSAFVAVGGFDEAYYGAEEVILSRALRRQGKFVILRSAVVTSARKLRVHSARELMTATFRIARRGTKAVQQREGLELWYGERRDDPPRDA